ncbi:MAG: hypothetical protein AB7I33_14015 [Gemmatimonadales bacterium]
MRGSLVRGLVAATGLMLVGAGAAAQNPPPPGCPGPEYRQFDFWVGEWNVTAPGGAQAGTNSITTELLGCVLHEHWDGAQGGKGESFNIYDATRKVWHQTWVSDRGTLLTLEGTLKGDAMVLEGESIARNGKTVQNRVTWTPRPDGAVRQLWEVSRDGGATWGTVFDGLYVKKK